MSVIGLTVKHGDTLGLVLDYDETNREYDVDFEDGRRFKTAHVTWVPEIEADPETALYRQSNRSERLYFESGYGWDVYSADDDLLPVDQQQQALIGRNPMDIPQRDVDPAWGLEPDANLTFYPSNPDLENQENTHPFFDVAPKPTREDQESYPSMASAVTALNFHREPPEPPADWGDEPNLEKCPNCGGFMTDSVDHQSAHCEECGHTQPIDYLSRRQTAALPFAPIAEGIESMMGGAGADAAVAGGSGGMLAGGGLGIADDLIGSAVQAGGGKHGPGADQGSGSDIDMDRFQQTLSANEDTTDSTGANRNDGRDSSPATADTNSYEGKDGPENFKDVGGNIGSDSPDPLALFSTPAVINYMKTWADSDKSGAEDPIIRGFDEALAAKYPDHYKKHTKTAIESHEEYMEKVAARKGKMCPFHSDLVDYALELGDPAAATAALSRHMYSPNSCKGGWAGDDPRKPSKCRFKPQMIKQEYWDEKERQAEERKQQREQLLAEQPIQDPNAVSPEIPVDQPSAVGIPEETQEFQETEPGHMVVQDVPDTDPLVAPTDYNPSPQGETNVTPIESAPSYSPSPMPVAARVATATDSSGQPLVKGQVYEMLSSNRGDVIPDIVQITSSDDRNVNFVVKGKNGITYQDSLPIDSINTEGIVFRPHNHNPNAHGLPLDSVSESQGNTDNTHYVGPGKDDLDSGANSHGAKTAGRAFSVTEQNMFVAEPGRARNLDKLDLSGTHYQEEADLDDDFVTGW